MLSKCILIFCFCFTSYGAFCQLTDCSKFKEGKFKINDARAGGVIIAERKGSYQTESMDALKAIVRFKISWLNDCTYTLTLDKIIRNENNVPFPENLLVSVKIISTNDTGYTQEISSSISGGTYRTAVTKL